MNILYVNVHQSVSEGEGALKRCYASKSVPYLNLINE